MPPPMFRYCTKCSIRFRSSHKRSCIRSRRKCTCHPRPTRCNRNSWLQMHSLTLRHLKFALRGCLAASGCYIIYNSDRVAKHRRTRYSHVPVDGDFRCRSLSAKTDSALRRVRGGRAPYRDRLGDAFSRISIRIGGFAIFFILVMALVSWFMRHQAPRLSYFGFQIAVVFCPH